MSSPPTATGTLGATPLSNLLIYVLDRRLTGTLVLEDYRARKAAIRLVGGVPLKVRLPEQAHTLAEIAGAELRIDAPTLESTHDVARATGRLHGAVLVEQGHVTAKDLRRLLAEQVACKVEWLCTLRPDTQFGYYDGQDFLATYGSHEEPPVEPLSVIRRVIRRGADPALVAATLGRLGDRELRLHPGSRPARFAFEPKERAVVDVLRLKPQSLDALLASGLAPPDTTRLIVFTLLATRHLDLGGQAAPVGLDAEPPPSLRTDTPPRTQAPPGHTPTAPPARGTERPAAPARARPPEEIEAQRAEIRERAAGLGKTSLYDVLGVDSTAPAGVVQSAFFQLAKRWHPDRIGPELADVRDLAVKVFARMSEANQVLTNEERRHEYDRLVKQGGGTQDEQDEVRRVLKAAEDFQAAATAMKRNAFDDARALAKAASEGDPEQAEYRALYADLLSMQPERAQLGNFADVIRLVNEAKKLQPDNLNVRIHRARVLTRAGDFEGAYREYRGVVEKNANHVEAAREVRLFQMRRGKSTTDPRRTAAPASGKGSVVPPPKDAGLIGKFFKR